VEKQLDSGDSDFRKSHKENKEGHCRKKNYSLFINGLLFCN
jgi:hypothetical protein